MPEKAKAGIFDFLKRKEKIAERQPGKPQAAPEAAEALAERRERQFDFDTAVATVEKAPGKGEDRNIVHQDNEKGLFAVLDGMGGQEGGGGDVAAQIVAESFQNSVFKEMNLPKDPQEVEKLMTQAVLDAHAALRQSTVAAIYEKMGTTLSAMVSYDNKATIVSTGDSRVYRLRKGELQMLSYEDSFQNILKNNGVEVNMSILSSILPDGSVHDVTLNEAMKSARRTKEMTPEEQKQTDDIVKVFGGRSLKSLRNLNSGGIAVSEAAPDPHVLTVDIEDGDEFMITSDGLTDNCQDRNIEQGLRKLEGRSSQEKAAALKEYAQKMQNPAVNRDANKPDDISIIYIEAKRKKGGREEEIEEIGADELMEEVG